MQVLAESHLAFLIGNDDDEPDQTAPKATASVDNIRIVKQVEWNAIQVLILDILQDKTFRVI